MEEIMEKIPADKVGMGNIDPSSEFRNGTPESIYAATTELLKKCSKYPNFVLSSGCDIPPLSPWENIDAFFKASEDFYA
jgi:uroporphyrinogen decarboxylase